MGRQTLQDISIGSRYHVRGSQAAPPIKSSLSLARFCVTVRHGACYNPHMVKLTEEQRAALEQNPDGVACEDVATQRVYFLVDEQIHRRAMLALKEQQDLEAIRRGVAQMEAGGGTPLHESRERLARELGFSNSGQ